MANMPDDDGNFGIDDPRQPSDIQDVNLLDNNQRRVTKDYRGVAWEDQAVGLLHRSRRPFYTKTRIQNVGSSTTKWRPQTKYLREVFVQTTLSPLVYAWGKPPGSADVTTTALHSAEFHEAMTNWTSSGSVRGGYVSPYKWLSYDGDPEVENILHRAEVECLLKLKDQKFDAGTFLAEAMKTGSHLAKTAVDLYGSVAALRGKDWKSLLNILSKRSPLHSRKITAGKTAAQYWLEYNYAWKPLIGEAYGAYQLFTERVKPALLLHAKRNLSADQSGTRAGYAGPWDGYDYAFDGTVKKRVTVRLTAELESEAIRHLTRGGLINPAAVAWEVVPYSFVIDWAMPIGNVLQAMDATNGLRFVGGSKCVKSFTHGYVKFRQRRYWSTTYTPGEAEVAKFMFTREPYSAFPVPQLHAKSPFSSSHLASAIALIRQLV